MTSRLHRVLAHLTLGLLLGVPLASRAQAQSTGIVRGRVVEDGTAVPVPGATITIVGTRLGGVSDNDGRYIIRSVPAGAQSVRFTRIGLTPQAKDITSPPTRRTSSTSPSRRAPSGSRRSSPRRPANSRGAPSATPSP